MEYIILIILIITSVSDIKHRTVPIYCQIALLLTLPFVYVNENVWGVLLAIPFLVASGVSGGMGGGDWKMVGLLGLCLGFYKTFAATLIYNQWCMIQKKIVGTYTDKEIEQPKLWENKEFKKIRNAVVQEAVRFEYDDDINIEQKETDTTFESTDEPMDSDTDEETVKDDKEQSASHEQPMNTDVAMSAFNLFCRLANIIDNDGEKKIDGYNKTIVDSKERRELMKKKQRLGIKMR